MGIKVNQETLQMIADLSNARGASGFEDETVQAAAKHIGEGYTTEEDSEAISSDKELGRPGIQGEDPGYHSGKYPGISRRIPGPRGQLKGLGRPGRTVAMPANTSFVMEIKSWAYWGRTRSLWDAMTIRWPMSSFFRVRGKALASG